MATFNIELWQRLKSDFLDGSVFFGSAPEATPAPYCVVYVLDSGDDEQSKTLCRTDGESELQFTIYGFNDMQLDELLDRINNLIKTYKNLENYRIKTASRKMTKCASSFSADVGAGITRFQFSFEKL